MKLQNLLVQENTDQMLDFSEFVGNLPGISDEFGSNLIKMGNTLIKHGFEFENEDGDAPQFIDQNHGLRITVPTDSNISTIFYDELNHPQEWKLNIKKFPQLNIAKLSELLLKLHNVQEEIDDLIALV